MADIDVVAAHANVEHLSRFDGRDVVRTTLVVTNAGDGLTKALAVEPRELHHGEEVVIVIRGTVSKVGFVPLDADEDDSALIRVHTVKAGDATLLDEASAAKIEKNLNAQRDRITKAVEAAKGISRLEGIAPDLDADDPDADPVEPTPIR